MARKTSKTDGMLAYLDRCKVLENGTAVEIAAAKAAYRKVYKAAWRKQNRVEFKHVTISLSKEQWQQVKAAARTHKRSCTRFITEACLAYINKVFLLIDVLEIRTIEQLLAMTYDEVRRAFDNCQVPYDTGKELLAKIEALEAKVIQELNHPKEVKIGDYGS